MRFAIGVALLAALVTRTTVDAAPVDKEKTDVFFFPSFGVITSIDFDQLIRSEMARESLQRIYREPLDPTTLAMKRSIAIGRAGFRPGKRAMTMGSIPRLPMILFNH